MDAAVRMARLRKEIFRLSLQNKSIYNKLFAEYVTLHDYFGWEENNVMKQLRR
jgi:L-ribulokinase